jgi:ribosomal protein L11 methyltransferase
MKYTKVEIIVNDASQDEIIAILDDYDPTGFEQQAETLVAYFRENSIASETLGNLLEGFSFSLSDLEERNWNEEWEKAFDPVIVEDFVAVRAHFHPPVSGISHDIIITPKMSFGTGHHATTYMMMQQMRDIDFEGKTVFDFGTGTGILAILAERLGAASITAIDVDEWSINNATENILQNECCKIQVFQSSDIPAQPFDIVLANINRNVILEYLPMLSNGASPKQLLLLSGLLTTDEQVIHGVAEENSLILRKRGERQGWLSLLLTNNRRNSR